MSYKRILQELCEKLEKELNRREIAQSRTVKLFSGLRPSDYYIPMMHVGTTESIVWREAAIESPPKERDMAWFVEVSVDGRVIFREYYTPSEEIAWDVIERSLIKKVLFNIFTAGIMSSKRILEERKI